MALDIPQGDVADDPGTDAAIGGAVGGGVAVKPPGRNGTYTGQTVRKNGYVWEYNAQSGRTGWRRVRRVTERDRRNIPPAEIGLDAGYKEGSWRERYDRRGGGGNTSGGGSNDGGGRNRSGGGAGGEDATRLRGIPAGGELWKVGGDHFVVYRTEIGGRSVRMSWKVSGKGELDRITSGGQIKPSKSVTYKNFRSRGIAVFGSTVELENETQHPFLKFRSWYRDEVKIKPWLRNREMLQLHVSAWLETGGPPSQAQISQTRWWQTHTPTERAALMKYGGAEGDKAFKEEFKSIRQGVLDNLISRGFDFAGGNKRDVANWFAKEIIWGRMTQAEFDRYAEQVSNPHARDAHWSAGINGLPKGARIVRHNGKLFMRHNGKDYRLQGFAAVKFGGMGNAKKVGNVNVAGAPASKVIRRLVKSDGGLDAVSGIERVRDMVNEWLGPRYGKGFSQRDIAQWAQRIEENPQAEQELIQRLRERRNIVLPDYDKALTWRDIAQTWQPVAASIWGEPLNEDSALFERVVKLKDRAAAEQYLREKGLEKDNDFVIQQFVEDAGQAFGDDGVRPGGF